MKTMRFSQTVIAVAIVISMFSSAYAGGGAPGGAPQGNSVWSEARKTGIGTSYEQYLNYAYSDAAETGKVSRVWFTIAQGIITETSFGLIHEAQLKDMQFLITGNGFFDEERKDTDSQIEYLHKDGAGRPLSLAYQVITTDKEGKYRIEKHIFTDPDRQSLFMHVIFTAYENGITPYLLVNPHIDNTGSNDVAYVSDTYLNSRNVEDNKYLSVKSTASFIKTSAGFVGASDGWTDLNDNGVMDWEYDYANGGGNVAMTAQLETLNSETVTFDIVTGFGSSHSEALAQADSTLNEGYSTVLNKYNGSGSYVGWEDYIQSLSELPVLIAQTGDNGKLLYASALLLKAQEDKTHGGALIASLSIPWGDTESAEGFKTGYRAVWARDFYQVASAMLAMGDYETPLVALNYLKNKIQVKYDTCDGNFGAQGWFLQKTHVNGTCEWVRVQLDQTAMPIMLAWKLWKESVLTSSDINSSFYTQMIKPAAEFLANGGHIELSLGYDSYTDDITPPFTRQERWEEEAGESPSTIASVITGLITAADIAENVAGDNGAANWYKTKADEFESRIEQSTYTTSGPYGDGDYFLRITDDENPNDGTQLCINNGSICTDERRVLDAGFLEFVRYGVREADSYSITESIEQIDDMSLSHDARIKYEFYDGGNVYPGWRRYSFDAYGERTDGSNFTGDYSTNRGRVWPIFTGERGHYELEKIKADNGGTISPSDIKALKNTYVKGMEYFANQGLMISEQVWDSVGNNGPHNYHHGEGTNSATPLAWSHAEYVKLVRSLTDKNTWDSYSVVRDRYDSPDNVEFTCYNGYTNLGQNVYVGGSIPELGNWDTDKAIKLDPTEYPIWSKVISLSPNITFEWKCIIKSPVYWQPGPNNHHTTPESGLSYTQGSF